jgi:hypothetical protein
MTGGAGNTFALVPGNVADPGGTAQVPITIAPPLFTLPKQKMVLGIDVVPKTNSSLTPLISRVDNPHNEIVPQAIHSIYNPHLSHAAVARGVGTRAVLAPLTQFPNQPGRPATYTVNVEGAKNTSGDFLIGFYLPGDANGDGVVDASDLALVRSLAGSRAGDSKYSFDADANRDGRIGRIDIAYTQQNQGVKTLVTPVVTANLDPASDAGTRDRVTNLNTVHFQGRGTPGAQVTFSELTNKVQPVSAQIDAAGHYTVMVPLGDGGNTFKVTTSDAFGQTITGQLSPVTRMAKPPGT